MYAGPSSSTHCPKRGERIEEVSHRFFGCPNYGYENHRDVVTVMDLYRGSSGPLDCSHTRDVNPNR
ncbi:hypothetical protein [Metallosphaera tengchongensis]|uniref:hypothetical protein n=1 Tax=Metallosphaera tengchongensis TaxID=1532350 RepID=UPI003CCE2106